MFPSPLQLQRKHSLHPFVLLSLALSNLFGSASRAVGLKPTDPAELLAMQNKELNNGRLAMIAIAGMIVQEGVTGSKLF